MKFTGKIYCWADGEAPKDYRDLSPFMVFEASMTRTELCIEWTEDGYNGTLVALSSDGKTYRGTYTFRELPGRRYASVLEREGPGVLKGKWVEEDGFKGSWVIELAPAAAAVTFDTAEHGG